MSGQAQREMTLDEWVNTLPAGHRAHRELAELRASSPAEPPAGRRDDAPALARANAAALRAFGQSAYDAKNYEGGFHCFLKAIALEEFADQLERASSRPEPEATP